MKRLQVLFCDGTPERIEETRERAWVKDGEAKRVLNLTIRSLDISIESEMAQLIFGLFVSKKGVK